MTSNVKNPFRLTLIGAVLNKSAKIKAKSRENVSKQPAETALEVVKNIKENKGKWKLRKCLLKIENTWLTDKHSQIKAIFDPLTN